MPTPVARTGTCARPEFWRSQRSRAHKPPPQPDASPDADPQMHVWSVRCGRCARAKTSGIKVQPRHPSGCLVLNPRDPGRAVWQYPPCSIFVLLPSSQPPHFTSSPSYSSPHCTSPLSVPPAIILLIVPVTSSPLPSSPLPSSYPTIVCAGGNHSRTSVGHSCAAGSSCRVPEAEPR